MKKIFFVLIFLVSSLSYAKENYVCEFYSQVEYKSVDLINPKIVINKKIKLMI